MLRIIPSENPFGPKDVEVPPPISVAFTMDSKTLLSIFIISSIFRSKNMVYILLRFTALDTPEFNEFVIMQCHIPNI